MKAEIVQFRRPGKSLSLGSFGRRIARLSPVHSREKMHQRQEALAEKERLLATIKQDFLGVTDVTAESHGPVFFLENPLPNLVYGGVWPYYKDLPLPARIYVENGGNADAGFTIESGPYKAKVEMTDTVVSVEEKHPKTDNEPQLKLVESPLDREIAWLLFANEVLSIVAKEFESPPSLPPAA